MLYSMKVDDGSIELLGRNGKSYSLTATQISTFLLSKPGTLAKKIAALKDDLKTQILSNIGCSDVEIVTDQNGKIIDLVIYHG